MVFIHWFVAWTSNISISQLGFIGKRRKKVLSESDWGVGENWSQMMPTTASLLEKHELEKFPTKDIFNNFNQGQIWFCHEKYSNFNFYVDWKGSRTWRLPRRGIWDFSNKLAQKDWLYMLFKDHVLRNQNCSVLQYSCALFVFSVIFPLHSVDLGASGPLSCHVQMFEKPGCAPVTKKIRKTNALRGLFCLNAGEMGEGEKVKVFLQQQKNRTGELELLEGQRLHPPSI